MSTAGRLALSPLRWASSDATLVVMGTFISALCVLVLGFDITTRGRKVVEQTGALSAVAGPILGVLAGAAMVVLVRQGRRAAGLDAQGRLNIAPAIAALEKCQPDVFDGWELRRRRKLNREIAKLAVVIDDIPLMLKLPHEKIVRAAAARGQGLRALQVQAAQLTEGSKSELDAALKSAKVKYDSGRWMEMPVDNSVAPAALSRLARMLWACGGLLCVAALVGIISLTVFAHVPSAPAAAISFAASLILYAALSRLGLTPETMKDAVAVSSMAQGALGVDGADRHDGKRAQSRD